MHSLVRAILAVLPFGMVASASRPVGAPREMTLLVAATTDVHGGGAAYATTHHSRP